MAPDRFVAYLFDDVHMKFTDLAQARDAAGRHLDASLEPGSRAAIYTTSGQTMLDFTDDRAKLHETLLRLRPRSVSRAPVRECPDISYYMADLIVNKSDSQALGVAKQEVIICEHLTPDQAGMAEQSARMAAQRVLGSGGTRNPDCARGAEGRGPPDFGDAGPANHSARFAGIPRA